MQMERRSGREGRSFHLHLPLFSLSCASGPKERKPLRHRRGPRPGRRSRACPVMGMRLPAPPDPEACAAAADGRRHEPGAEANNDLATLPKRAEGLF